MAYLPYQVITGTDNTKRGYVRQRTLCMSVNDISRIKTWGMAKYGWTDVIFTCNPLEFGFSKQNDLSVQNCQCDGDGFMVNGPAEQKMFNSTGRAIAIVLGIACAVLIILVLMMYMRRAPMQQQQPRIMETRPVLRGHKKHTKREEEEEENGTRTDDAVEGFKLKM